MPQRGARSALLGRDGFMRAVRLHVERAGTGHGGLLLITGEAGIGKTSLTGYAIQEARREDMLVLRGSCWGADGTPGLSGATLDEHRTFVGMMYDAVGRPFTEADYDQALRTAFGERPAKRVRAEYPTDAFPSPALAWATVITDRMWARGTQAQHDALARHVPLYAYEFADRDAPMFLPLPGDFDFGAFHTGDIPYLFEDEVAEPLFTPAQRRLSATMTGYWAAFARTGAPGDAGLPTWPRYRPGLAARPYTQSLAPRRIGPVDYHRRHKLDFWSRLP
ncbi:carboxylesterase family protein [Streptomyces chartreusis]|uniref:carboxylesterase family protein n=1 Tax=Streptomyces chartreusis TaxID=1969 RepID=UPI0036346D9C